MSERNVESLRRGIDAYNERDIDALIAHCDPEIEFQSAFSAVGGATYHGHDGLRQWHRDVEEAWGEQVRVEPEVFFTSTTGWGQRDRALVGVEGTLPAFPRSCRSDRAS